MRWPWQSKPETRDSGGTFYDAVLRAIEAEASGSVASVASTAAAEAAAGALSRAFAAATVEGGAGIVSPHFLQQVGRDFVIRGESLHAIRMMSGSPALVPLDQWHWQGGDHNPATWRCRATAYGPSTSTTWDLPASSVVHVSWGIATARPYQGVGPLAFAGATARLGAQAEKSLADEAAGPLAQLLPYPQDGGNGEDDDPLAMLKADITAAKGKALLVETTAAGLGEGPTAAPRTDWKPNRLGPAPPETMVEVARDAFDRTVAACGCSPALFDNSDGTSKREALRQFHLGTVRPLARLLEIELSAKLAEPVRLGFDLYNVDLAGRAQSFKGMVAGGMDVAKAAGLAGLMLDE